MIVHESGHVLAAGLSGGQVSRVVLDPLAFSQTELLENPRPLFVAWAGPVWGSIVPLGAWLAFRAAGLRLTFLVRAFAGFCFLANGAYLASAAIMPVGDTEDLLRLGAPLWAVSTPGVVGFVGGLLLLNGLGPDFGLDGRPVDRSAVAAAILSLAFLATGMVVWTYVL
ncbi:MAG: hypothetical protein AMXMBFR58_22550 [Phycisphaerae bacterium]